jgi:hypothetical protein
MADFIAKEYKVVSLRDCPVPEQMQICEQPQQVADYWRMHIATHPYFNPECECFVVLLLNTRRRVKGHQLVTVGTMDTLLVHAREVFRTAIVCSASAIALSAAIGKAVVFRTVAVCGTTESCPSSEGGSTADRGGKPAGYGFGKGDSESSASGTGVKRPE